MIEIDHNCYKNLAQILIAAIGEHNYFSGTIEYDTEEFHSKLTTTLIIYRETILDPSDPSHSATHITDIVPVWWEFHTHESGIESDNDFCWGEIKEFLF